MKEQREIKTAACEEMALKKKQKHTTTNRVLPCLEKVQKNKQTNKTKQNKKAKKKNSKKKDRKKDARFETR